MNRLKKVWQVYSTKKVNIASLLNKIGATEVHILDNKKLNKITYGCCDRV